MHPLRVVNPFERARRNLTIFYCAILIIVLSAFSVGLFTTQTRTFNRIVIQRSFGNRLPIFLTDSQIGELREQVDALRHDLIVDLLLIDFSILAGGAILSYFLAGKTLEPIQKTLDEQKKFIADASHELRTPLTAVISASEVALRSENKSKDDYKKVIRQVNSVATDMSIIVNELLTISKLGSSGFLKELKKVNLEQVLNQALSEISPMADKKNIVIKKELIDQVEVLGDPNKLKQLMIILLDNSIKYNKDHGQITLSLKNSPKKMLTISDSGQGISKEDLKQTFKRFFRGDKSRTTPGAGLGLSIALEIATLHKAIIEVDSKLGEGSTFKIIFN